MSDNFLSMIYYFHVVGPVQIKKIITASDESNTVVWTKSQMEIKKRFFKCIQICVEIAFSVLHQMCKVLNHALQNHGGYGDVVVVSLQLPLT